MAQNYVVALAAATDTLVSAVNRRRKWLLIINDGANDAYLMLEGKTAVVNQGIRLDAAGGAWEVTLTNPYYGEVRGISTGGSTLILSEESA